MKKSNSPKFYIIVREDISPGYQIAQSVHAKDKFTHEYPSIEKEWYENSNTIVVLGVSSENVLLSIAAQAKNKNLAYSLFFEPDIQEYTAIALQPGEITKNMLSNFSTAGNNKNRGRDE